VCGCGVLFGAMLTMCADASLAQTPEDESVPSFRSGVDLVTVTAVVRDRRGRLVSELDRDDFEVLDGGEPQPILDFWANDDSAVSVGVLLDVSGSMAVGSKMADARFVANHLLESLRPGVDEHGVFAFDTTLRQIVPFTRQAGHFEAASAELSPYGATSFYDAIAETAERMAERPSVHKAVVAISDGIDTRSKLTAAQVSGIASAIDVPIYVLAVVSPLDVPHEPTAADGTTERAGQLKDLANWTGGGVYFASAPREASQATADLLSELRHQYVLVFEPSVDPGWRLIEVRVRGRPVQTRSAYQAMAMP